MNKIIMITGATAGFGKATAVQFAKNGYDIIITGRRKERLDGTGKGTPFIRKDTKFFH